MDRTDILDMFKDDIVGGTSLSDDSLERILDQALKLLKRLTTHTGIDFMTDEPIILLHAMQYYYDLLQRNFEASDKQIKSLGIEVAELNKDWVQVEQADFPAYMGDRT